MSTKGITGKEPDPRDVYADIIDLPHHQSPTRPHMSLYDRAAQISEGRAPEVTVTFFVPDERKKGGSYQRYNGTVKKVDPILQQVVFYPEDGSRSGMTVDLSLISDLAGEDIGDADDV